MHKIVDHGPIIAKIKQDRDIYLQFLPAIQHIRLWDRNQTEVVSRW